MKNTKGLNRFMSTFSGMLYIGKAIQSHHPSMGNDEVYMIESKGLNLEFTQMEAIRIANDILKQFGEKDGN